MSRTPFKHTDLLLHIFFIIFFVSLIYALRAVSTIAMGFIFVINLARNRMDTGRFFNKRVLNVFIISCGIYFLLQVLSLLYSKNIPGTLHHLTLTCALILVPMALCCSNYLTPLKVRGLMSDYVWVMAAAMMFYIAMALYSYFISGTADVFFYHALVSPFRHNAVQVSVLLCMGIIFLLRINDRTWQGYSPGKDYYSPGRFIHLLLILFFFGCILLLSSRLVIILSAVFIFHSFIISFWKKGAVLLAGSIIIGIVITIILVTPNRVSSRFHEIVAGDISLIEQQRFSPAVYFNGLQFRLLQWRFVSQVLSENNAWLIGVSPGDAQALLNEKYMATNMYLGETRQSGFLGYNTHNQYLQSLLQNGLVGLIAFFTMMLSLVAWVFIRRNLALGYVVALLVAYGFMDSYLETQYGILIFTFWGVVFYYGSVSNSQFAPVPIPK